MTRQDHTSKDLKRLERDNKTVVAMARIFCHSHNHIRTDNEDLCPHCLEVIEYAKARTAACPHNHKGTCDTCSIQCYKPEMREQIRTIMAYSGPRMMFHHPLMAIRHLINKHRGRSLHGDH